MIWISGIGNYETVVNLTEELECGFSQNAH